MTEDRPSVVKENCFHLMTENEVGIYLSKLELTHNYNDKEIMPCQRKPIFIAGDKVF